MTRFPAALRRFTLGLAAIFGFMTVAVPAAQASLVSAAQYAKPSAAAEKRSQVQAFLQREDVQAQLVELGVDPQTAQDRVDALSEAELARVAHLIDRPADQAAGAGVVGAIVFIFVLLLITDLLGLTDVFTFVRK